MIEKVKCKKELDEIITNLNNCEGINYLTEEHVIMDYEKNELFTLKNHDNKVVAIASLVWEHDFKMFYIKRLKVFEEGLGYGKKILNYLSNIHNTVAITPFECNKGTIKIITELGFNYQYTFLDDYLLYIKQKSLQNT